MDIRERLNDGEELLRSAMDSNQAGIWTALPAIIQSFNPTAMTCTAQPSIQGRVKSSKGVFSNVNLPLLVDCPVVFPSGGGFSLTFPVTAGDECLIVFSSRCIDAWWQQGGVQPPLEARMHDLSDGFAFVGCRSQAHVISGVSTSTTQLRSNDGGTFVEIAGGGIINIKAPTKVKIDTPILEITGAIQVDNVNSLANPCTISGSIQATGDVVAEYGSHAISLKNHTHNGVTTGGGNTGVPN